MKNSINLINIQDEENFKKMNHAEWEKNTSFWLKAEMNHISDTKKKVADKLESLISTFDYVPLIVDVGCGEGWIYRLIKELKLKVNYVGIDFNEGFIENLSKSYMGESDCEFYNLDIETPLPNSLVNCADIVINAFNFFEIPKISQAFENTTKILKNNAFLFILTIDPITQILAVTENYDDLFDTIEEYSDLKNNLAYRKSIVVGNKKTNRSYYGILYSFKDYLYLAKKNGLTFYDFDDLIKGNRPTPQIFQFITFRK